MTVETVSDSPLNDPESFLELAGDFHLGELMSEAQHPDTLELSALARNDLPEAIKVLKQADLDALEKMKDLAHLLIPLAEEIQDTLSEGRRIFLCGCGATGRLSLSLEIFARGGLLGEVLEDGKILGFMAGGDAALIRSIESFEDFPEYGARQLMDLGFVSGDLLIATTEGGETPFVIGATEAAAALPGASSRSPYFLYCNPDEVLCRVAERSKQVIESPAIQCISLPIGPMALSGSTRMQASTVLMAAVAWAIAQRDAPERIGEEVEKFISDLRGVDFTFLQRFIETEAEHYQAGQHVLYEASADYGITVLTDTTERAPTFSLVPFQNQSDLDDLPSLCYLHLQGASTAAEAWKKLLQREPRTLEWEGVAQVAGSERLLGFDFSDQVLEALIAQKSGGEYLRFQISDETSGLRFRLVGKADHLVEIPAVSAFSRQLLLKLMLNIHSTLVMGRLGRYEDNLMTYVSASNNKLIDRALRYVDLLLRRRVPEGGEMPDYESLCHELFRQKVRLHPGESVVIKTMESFL